MKRKNAFFIFIAEPQPILSKDSARRAQWKEKTHFLFSLPSRSLSYVKIVQGERNEKENALFQILIK